MTRAYAEGTSVPVEKTRGVLDRLLGEHGATQRMMGADDAKGIAFVAFAIEGRQVRLRVPIPTRAQLIPAESDAPRGWLGWSETQRAQWCDRQQEQIARERWRALLLLCKAKLEMVALGVSTVEREFLADISLPNGTSVHDHLRESLAKSYLTGKMPPLLGSGT